MLPYVCIGTPDNMVNVIAVTSSGEPLVRRGHKHDTVTPEVARDLARMLIDAANRVETEARQVAP